MKAAENREGESFHPLSRWSMDARSRPQMATDTNKVIKLSYSWCEIKFNPQTTSRQDFSRPGSTTVVVCSKHDRRLSSRRVDKLGREGRGENQHPEGFISRTYHQTPASIDVRQSDVRRRWRASYCVAFRVPRTLVRRRAPSAWQPFAYFSSLISLLLLLLLHLQ